MLKCWACQSKFSQHPQLIRPLFPNKFLFLQDTEVPMNFLHRIKYFSIMYDFIKSGYLNELLLFFAGIPITSYHLPLLYIVGFLLWTLDEYVIHRWLFHLCPPSKYPVIVILHFLFHGQHHKVNKRNWLVQTKKKAIEDDWLWKFGKLKWFINNVKFLCEPKIF